MKTYFLFLVSLLPLVFFASCEKEIIDEVESKEPIEAPGSEESGVVPEGYFEVTFSPGTNDTRAAVSGSDGRVQHLRYIIYNSAGAFVKEKVVLVPASGIPTWPLPAVKDTLPKGSYTAIFLANVEKTLFPYTVTGGGQAFAEVLTNYQGSMANARINLPSGQFSTTSEYYWAKVPFSDTSAHPYILLQRILGMFNVHRNAIDAQDAMNKLLNNIVTQLNYKNTIQTTVQGLLPGLVRSTIDQGPLGNAIFNLIGGLDAAVNAISGALLLPVTNALYDMLLQRIVDQLGSTLEGNANQNGIARLGILLNPWESADAQTAIVTIRNFPKAVDFNLAVTDVYAGDVRFRIDFPPSGAFAEKDLLIRGFNGVFDVRRVNVIRQGLIGGFVVDGIIDSNLLLPGSLIDITDPIQATVATNRRYKANYSLIDVGLKSYTQQTDGNHSLTLSVKVGNIANIDNVITNIPLLGPALGIITAPLKNITVSVPINLPLLGADNITISGSWSAVTPY